MSYNQGIKATEPLHTGTLQYWHSETQRGGWRCSICAK